MRSHACIIALGITTAWALQACSSSSNGSSPATDAGTHGDASSPGTDGGGMMDSSMLAADAAGDGAPPAEGGPASDSAAPSDAGMDGETGTTAVASALYTMTNAATGNAILGFTRGVDGSLTAMAAPFPTGGNGSGAALGEQGAIVYDLAGDRVFAVNAGDDSFSVLPVEATGALGTAVDVAASAVPGGGALLGPKSVTVHGNTVYVLFEGNATTASAIAGWTVDGTTATFIAGSISTLSSATESVDPAQIQFTPDGDWLVVTEKQSGGAASVAGSGNIDTFAVSSAGLATKKGFYPTASAGVDAGVQLVPYGFAFSGTTLVVSEAGSTGAGAYTYTGGVIAPVTGATQFLATDAAPCWVAVSADWAYVANAKGPDVSGFTVSATTGGLTDIGSATNAVVATTGSTVVTDAGTTVEGPTDEAVSADGKFLYVLDGAQPAIGAFAVNADGTLTRVGSTDFTSTTLVANVVGLAAR
ncbi:MAG TPA: hypothetical protein VGM06_17895 [Polyangiaceae bacterium]